MQLGGGSYLCKRKRESGRVVGRKAGHGPSLLIPELGPSTQQGQVTLMASDSPVFTAMVSRLGGPSIAPEELDWALDTPAGARIMDFFLSKVQLENKSLGDVALEKEERDMSVPRSSSVPTDF